MKIIHNNILGNYLGMYINEHNVQTVTWVSDGDHIVHEHPMHEVLFFILPSQDDNHCRRLVLLQHREQELMIENRELKQKIDFLENDKDFLQSELNELKGDYGSQQ